MGKIIHKLQKKLKLGVIKFFMTMVYFGGIGVLMSLVLIPFHFLSRQEAFYYSVVFSIAVFVRVNLRMLYRQPRPYMESLKV